MVQRSPKINLDLFRKAFMGLGLSAMVAAAFMLPHEGIKYRAYQDGVGVWTICAGHTRGVYEGMIATQKQCEEWYAKDIKVAQDAFDKLVPNSRSVPPNVKAAAISFIFNAGEGNFAKSTLRKKIIRGDYRGACNEFPKWRFAKGRDCTIRSNQCFGLLERRQKEKELCLEQTNYSSYFIGSDNLISGVRNP